LVPPGPYDVQRPAGIQPTRHPSAEASGGPPWTFAPLQSSSPGTRAVPPDDRQTDDTSSPGLSSPYDTVPGRRIRLPAADPSATAWPRPGFGYPPRGSYLRPSRRRSVGASMGFTLQGLPLAAIGTPLGAPALLPLRTASMPPRRGTPASATGFRALFLRRVRSVTGITNDSSRRFLLGVRPSRACSRAT
jgi:hypothetical protein